MTAAMSEPGQAAVEAFNASLASGSGEAPAAPEVRTLEQALTPTAEPASVEVATPAFDPATVRIPEDAQLPKHAEKYRGKTLSDVLDLDLRTQQWASEKAADAARLTRENSDLQARIAAAEQVQRMTQQPQQQPTDRWQQAGVDVNTQTFTEPGRVLDTTLGFAEQRAYQIAAEESRKTKAEILGAFQQQNEASMAVATFDTAKNKIRGLGYDLSDEDYVKALQYIAPRVEMENRTAPGTLFNPDRYVQAFVELRGGAPAKTSIPQEGNPPVAARPATVQSAQAKGIPSVSQEKQQVMDIINSAMKSRGLNPDKPNGGK